MQDAQYGRWPLPLPSSLSAARSSLLRINHKKAPNMDADRTVGNMTAMATTAARLSRMAFRMAGTTASKTAKPGTVRVPRTTAITRTLLMAITTSLATETSTKQHTVRHTCKDTRRASTAVTTNMTGIMTATPIIAGNRQRVVRVALSHRTASQLLSTKHTYQNTKPQCEHFSSDYVAINADYGIRFRNS